MMRAMQQIMAPLSRKLGLLVNRAVINLIDDSGKTQRLQATVLADEARESIEHMQPAGYKSVPLPGSDAVVLAVGGNGDHRIAIVTHDPEARPRDWQPGDVGIYHLLTGDLIWMRADGSVEITAQQRVLIRTPELRLEGNLQVSGDIADRQGSLRELRTTFNAHSHPPDAPAQPAPQMV